MNDKELMNTYKSIELSADRMAEMEAELMKRFDTNNDTESGYVNGGKAYKLQPVEKKPVSSWKIAVGIGSVAAVGLCVFGLSRLDFGAVSPISPANTQTGTSDNISYTENEYPLLNGTFKHWDADKVAAILLPDYDDKEESGDTVSVSFFAKGLEQLIVKDGSIIYNENIYDVRDFGFGAEVFEVNEEILRSLHPVREHEGFASADALKAAEEIVSQLDIPHLGEPQVYAATSTVNRSLVTIYGDQQLPYTEEQLTAFEGNEVYVVFYPTECNGIEMPIGDVRFADTDTTGLHGYIEIGVEKDGVFSFEAHNIMELTESGKTIKVCDMSDAAASLSTVLTEDADITEGELVYVGDFNDRERYCEYRPAWRFVQTIENEGKVEYKSHYVDANEASYQPPQTTTSIIAEEPEIVQPADGEISVSMLFDTRDYGFGWDFSIFEEHFAGVWMDEQEQYVVGYNSDIFGFTGDAICGGFAENEDGWYMLQSFADGEYSVYAALKKDRALKIRRYDLESKTQCISLDAHSEEYHIYSDAAAVTELGDSYAGEATLLTLTRLMRGHTEQYGESNLGELLGKLVYAPEYSNVNEDNASMLTLERITDDDPSDGITLYSSGFTTAGNADITASASPITYSIDGVEYTRCSVDGDSGKVWVNSLCEKSADISVRCYTMDYIGHLRKGLPDDSYSGIKAKYINLWMQCSDEGEWSLKGFDLWENDIVGIASIMPTQLSEKIRKSNDNRLTGDTSIYGDADAAHYVLRSMVTENTVDVEDARDGKFGSEYYTNGVTEIYYYDPIYNEHHLLDVLVGADMAVIDGRAYVVGGLPDSEAELSDIATEEVLCCYDRTQFIGRTVLDVEPYSARKLKAYGECLVATYWRALDNLDYKVFDSETLSPLCETKYSPMHLDGTGGIEELSEDSFVVKLAGANEIVFDGEDISGQLLLLDSRAQRVHKAFEIGDVPSYSDGSISMEGFTTLDEARETLRSIFIEEYVDSYLDKLLNGTEGFPKRIEERDGYLYYIGGARGASIGVERVAPQVESLDGDTAIVKYLVYCSTEEPEGESKIYICDSYTGGAEKTADGWRLTNMDYPY